MKRIVPGGTLVAVDRDPEAIERVRQSLEAFKEEVIYVNDDFRNIDRILEKAAAQGIDGAIFDLGISSFQIDDGARGFSFLKDGPLDMRFDIRQEPSAADVVNKFGREELADIIRKYGEERHSRLAAAAICAARKKARIETTGELANVILKALGGKYRKQRLHPAARTFQALRIFVNDELAAVEEAVSKTVLRLRPRGRICVISFHSLEDRIVKNLFRDMAKTGEIAVVTKKPVCPGSEEIRRNPRSRSAKLRTAERVK
ncbi:MAG: 16S rRNA (cytosine(1402)-N(4))-methyltransferase RsmH [Candidatus Omnitrophota bacterium]